MPRFARVVVTGEPYHITHRGNHRAQVFFEPEDREVYLAMLVACQRFELDAWSYCLMTNHVHLLAMPRSEVSMAAGVGRK
ncbi:MAG: transposase [Candidatus Sumerlaeaceae bacterium]